MTKLANTVEMVKSKSVQHPNFTTGEKNPSTSDQNSEQIHGHTNQKKKKMITTLIDVQIDHFICLSHEPRSKWSMKDNIKPISSAHSKPWQMSGHYERTVNSKSNLTGYPFTWVVRKATQSIRNIVCCLIVIISSENVVMFESAMSECKWYITSNWPVQAVILIWEQTHVVPWLTDVEPEDVLSNFSWEAYHQTPLHVRACFTCSVVLFKKISMVVQIINCFEASTQTHNYSAWYNYCNSLSCLFNWSW